MSKVTMIFKIRLQVEKTKNKIRVREKSHGETCDRSPISNFFITNGFRNDGTSKRMGNGIHKIMITSKMD